MINISPLLTGTTNSCNPSHFHPPHNLKIFAPPFIGKVLKHVVFEVLLIFKASGGLFQTLGDI